jgi:hypothetical protein
MTRHTFRGQSQPGDPIIGILHCRGALNFPQPVYQSRLFLGGNRQRQDPGAGPFHGNG